MKKLISILCFVLITVGGYAQQLDRLGIKKRLKQGIKISGGVSLANNFYSVSGMQNRLNPYSFFFTGNLSATVFGMAVPLTFSFSNQNYSTYRQPYNIIGASPTYKKCTFHIGYRNLSFSPYSLNGHNFLGGGFEYKGDKIGVMIMGGRLLKAVDYDSTNPNALPAYQRMGAGIKLSYRNKGDEISVSNFYAKDNVNSINPVPSSLGLTAMENVVWGLTGRKQLGSKFSLAADYGRSALTQDVTALPVSRSSEAPLSSVFYVHWNQSTVVYNAIKLNANYKFKAFSVGAGYERVDPGYRTLGAYYFNNDLENVTLNAAASFLKNKISVTANGGLQRDDLSNTKASSMKRTVGSVAINLNPTKRFNMNISYSNFFSYVNVKPMDSQFLPNSRTDTLNYTQISQTINGSASYKLLENDYVSQMVRFSSSTMMASSTQASATQTNGLINGCLAYNQAWKKSGANMGLSLNANEGKYVASNSLYLGVGINAGMPVLHKKLRTNLGINVNQNSEGNKVVADLIAINNSYSYKLGKHQSMSANFRYTGRIKEAQSVDSSYNTNFNEFYGTILYSYSF
jgi:hypothetical protein